MTLVQAFNQAVRNPENWFVDKGMARLNWNYVDADCYQASIKHYANNEAFYEDFDALCDIYCMNMNSEQLSMYKQLTVDTQTA